MMEQAWLLPALPALAFVVLALGHFLFSRYIPRGGDFIAIGAMAASFVLMVLVSLDLFDQLPALAADLQNNTSGFDWVKVEEIDFVLRVGFLVDQITVVMLIVVSFVGLMVMIYSLGYMRGEPRYGWFYAVLSLFVACMLTLVLADNFLLLYVVWEGVGICSFLLIGFYWERRPAAEAAKKAFITTRLGDVAMLIGIIMLWRETGTFDMSAIFHAAEEGEIGQTYLTVATLALFGGAMGKSAQFPFHVWLPDAMQGPTPVSALIHAATMVVAGIYLVARTMPLFEASDEWLLYFVIVVGMITTFMSAFMGLVMTDIKQVIAYSTLNSLGLMMVSLGLGEPGVAPAMLYLFAHAFFKALLFLAAGSVIHATEHQEVDHLGGLAAKMPITHWTFAVGALAMAGMIPLSGFWAKDEILAIARDESPVVLLFLLLSLPVTALYMARVYMLTFQGEPRDHHAFEHAHESPPVMSLPLIVLAVLAAVSGFVVFDAVGEAVGFGSGFLAMVENVFGEAHDFEIDWLVLVLSTALVAGALVVGWDAWTGERAMAREAAARAPFLYQLFSNKFYVDAFYQWVIDQVVLGFAKIIAFFDRAVVNDTGVNGPGEFTGATGWVLKHAQTGRLPNYAFAIIAGVVVLAIAGYAARG
ncbi:MAG TPA: NADH-quinone oxidoreductase subunit L [Dehalococcoidia bacterium]|nr:NADH-quinone oxidoreductase subunit L [Dehalococcoidia bacterium]